MAQEKTRQEEAYEYVSSTFVKLLEQDNKIGYELKRSILAFWNDLFADEATRDNMIQAFSNFLAEIDPKMDAARKAGIAQLRDALVIEFDNWGMDGSSHIVRTQSEAILAAENAPEEPTIKADDLANADLSEVGGGDEDDTSPL